MTANEALALAMAVITRHPAVIRDYERFSERCRDDWRRTVNSESNKIFEKAKKGRDLALIRGEKLYEARFRLPLSVGVHNVMSVLDALMTLCRMSGLRASAEAESRDMLGRYLLRLELC